MRRSPNVVSVGDTTAARFKMPTQTVVAVTPTGVVFAWRGGLPIEQTYARASEMVTEQ